MQLDFATGSVLTDKSAWNPKSESVADAYIGPGGTTGMQINNELRNIKDQMETSFKYFVVFRVRTHK